MSPSGDLYVADRQNHLIRKVLLSRGVPPPLAPTHYTADTETTSIGTHHHPEGLGVAGRDEEAIETIAGDGWMEGGWCVGAATSCDWCVCVCVLGGGLGMGMGVGVMGGGVVAQCATETVAGILGQPGEFRGETKTIHLQTDRRGVCACVCLCVCVVRL